MVQRESGKSSPAAIQQSMPKKTGAKIVIAPIARRDGQIARARSVQCAAVFDQAHRGVGSAAKRTARNDTAAATDKFSNNGDQISQEGKSARAASNSPTSLRVAVRGASGECAARMCSGR